MSDEHDDNPFAVRKFPPWPTERPKSAEAQAEEEQTRRLDDLYGQNLDQLPGEELDALLSPSQRFALRAVGRRSRLLRPVLLQIVSQNQSRAGSTGRSIKINEEAGRTGPTHYAPTATQRESMS